MVSKAFISMVQNLGTAYGRVLGVIDENAIVAACSDDSMTGSTRIGLPMSSAENSILRHGGYTYRYAEPEKRGSILFIEGEDENATRFINAAAIALNGLSEAGNGNNDLLSFVKRAMEKKVAVVPGTAFATDTQKYTAHSFRVTYATPTDEQLAEGVAILGDLVREMTK